LDTTPADVVTTQVTVNKIDRSLIEAKNVAVAASATAPKSKITLLLPPG
jgi:hypothetical protein